MSDPDPRPLHLDAALDLLFAALRPTLPSAASDWLTTGCAAVAGAGDAAGSEAAARLASAARRLGDAPLGAAGPVLETPCGPLATARWTHGDAGRACLLLAALGAGVAPAALVEALFAAGDEGERALLVRALCLLPAPCAALATARRAGRGNSLRLYAALALDNPYAACCYGERDFNQVVLKSLFNGLPLARVAGLAGRANPALSRLCEDYHDERVAAGRPVPADIWLALVPHAGPRGLALARARLADPDPAQRRYAADALAARPDAG